MFRLTTIAALVQPPPETFKLFDDVMLLAGGKIIYHGPVTGAIPFFCSLGFKHPPRKDPAAFLTELTTPEGTMFEQLNYLFTCFSKSNIKYFRLMMKC